jgi:hypothetical protein
MEVGFRDGIGDRLDSSGLAESVDQARSLGSPHRFGLGSGIATPCESLDRQIDICCKAGARSSASVDPVH